MFIWLAVERAQKKSMLGPRPSKCTLWGRNRWIWPLRSEMDGPDLTSVTAMGLPPSCVSLFHERTSQKKEESERSRETLAAAAAMPAEGTRMAGLWEREVGRLRPKRFANAFMASRVRPLSLPSSPSAPLLRSRRHHLEIEQDWVDLARFSAANLVLDRSRSTPLANSTAGHHHLLIVVCSSSLACNNGNLPLCLRRILCSLWVYRRGCGSTGAA
jgi:hypothetical protein